MSGQPISVVTGGSGFLGSHLCDLLRQAHGHGGYGIASGRILRRHQRLLAWLAGGLRYRGGIQGIVGSAGADTSLRANSGLRWKTIEAAPLIVYPLLTLRMLNYSEKTVNGSQA